ncbi:restriction endonuclease subunit S [Vibrio vulnificus]|uniref:restriction endonuclease subunit S n=1 Tax=Vibrio vulnificus TaxID=672 RepID=UPI00092C0F14|nr:restriction endonuclease subunit S [Vibrio vulnificus]OJI53624.1 Type-1 restriction enzyme EcoKI specificity protein [Vibrio vulnificus]OJI57803.1 Type-1 restriction enzyme EcoKI specificity protein [Vibrio fluvialis]POB26811.1 restriction endonuclease subunit S [Vibrio vulnificus]
MEQVLYKLPDGWEWKRIEEVFTITSGKNLTKKDMDDEGKFSVYGGNGIAGRYNDFNLSGSNIIIGRVGALCGNVRLVNGDIWVTDNAFFIKEYKVDILKEYLAQVLSALNLGETANKAAQPVISYKGIKDLVIPYPPLDEQKRIVEKLDALLNRIETAIEHLQESVTLKNSLLQSALDGQFSAITDRMTIESLAEVKGGKRLPKGEKLSDEETEHPYIRVADFTDKGTIDLSSIKYVSKEIHEQIKRYVISKDDLYISIAGTIGKTGFVPPELDGANLTENAAKLVIRDKQQLDLSYLYLFTLTSDFSAQAGLATKTVAQPKLALTRLSKIEIPMCSLEEQKSLVSTIEALKSKIHDAEAVLLGKIEDLKSLKASILDSAFKGEL